MKTAITDVESGLCRKNFAGVLKTALTARR